MELLKMINQDLHYRKALDRLFIQFPEIKDKGSDMYEIEWFHEADKPYVLVLNRYSNGKFIRKEWYEYYKSTWNYVGYLSREACIQYYRWQAWQKNKRDFPTFEGYMQYMSTRSGATTDEEAAQRFPEGYFTQYRSMRLKK